MKWEFTKNCRYKLRIVLLTYTLLTLIPAKCKSQVKITLGRQTIGRELPNLLISENYQSDSFYNGGGEGKWELLFLITSQSLNIRGGRRGLAGIGLFREIAVWSCLLLRGPTTVAATPKTSRQNRKPHSKNKNLTAKPNTVRFLVLPWCFSFALRFLVLPWQLWATRLLCSWENLTKWTLLAQEPLPCRFSDRLDVYFWGGKTTRLYRAHTICGNARQGRC